MFRRCSRSPVGKPPKTNARASNHNAQMPDYIPLLISSCGSLLLGFSAGWWSHHFASKREREARAHADKNSRDDRIAAFEALLLEWEQIAEKSSSSDIPRLYFDKAAGLFRSHAAAVRRDFIDREEFDRLDEVLSRMTPQAIRGDGTRTSREIIADAIREFIRFVRNA